METGASRNYEIWQDKDKSREDQVAEKEIEEKVDPMKALENRVLDSQREMADLDNLDEIKAMNEKKVWANLENVQLPADYTLWIKLRMTSTT